MLRLTDKLVCGVAFETVCKLCSHVEVENACNHAAQLQKRPTECIMRHLAIGRAKKGGGVHHESTLGKAHAGLNSG